MADRLSPLERAFLNEIEWTTNRRLTGKDLREWSSSEENVRKNLRDGEEIHYLPRYGVWVAILSKAPRKAKGGAS